MRRKRRAGGGPGRLRKFLSIWTRVQAFVWRTNAKRPGKERRADLLKRIAEKKSATPAQISLAWLLAQKPWIVSIPGTRKIDHLNENLGAVHVEMTLADLREIETALFEIKVHGGRMNEELMKAVDQTA